MENAVTSIPPQQSTNPTKETRPRLIPQALQVQLPRDTVQFGANGAVSNGQAMQVVLERAFEQLRAVVTEARDQLGIPEGTVLDTSPEATAHRIADFALGAFDRWHENHGELGEEEAREQFAAFIGGAISQGIEEARGILTALKALTPEVNTNIDTTYSIIQDRLNDFVLNGQ